MRYLARSFALMISAGALVIAMTAPETGLAAGNVLLPPVSGDTGSSPNLGLTAAPPPAASTAPEPPAPPSAPTTASAPAPSPPTTSSSSSAPMSMPMPDIKNMITQPASAAPLSFGQLPTQIVHLPDQSAQLAQMAQKMPYAMNVGMSPQSFFGSNDVKAITATTGLSRNQIADACLLTVRGVIVTSTGGALVNGGNASQFQVRYDGTIQSLMISGMALCTADHLPSGIGLVMMENSGRIQVPLQPVTCAAPTRQVSQLTITYTGDAKSQCVFQ